MSRRTPEKEAGEYQGHCACTKCGSNDAGSYYLHDDGSYSFTCFSAGCNHSIIDFDIETMEPAEGGSRKVVNWEEEMEKLEEVRDGLIAVDNKDRKLPASVYDFYGCKMELEADGVTIQKIFYPTHRDDELGNDLHVGYRNRKRFLEWHDAVKKDPSKLNKLKDFSGGIGDTKKGIKLFGQWLFNSTDHNRIILCCGEEDAMTVYKMTSMKTKSKLGYAAVSVPSGENVNGIKPHLDYISAYNEIYIVADQDDAGRIFEEQLCKLLPVGKVKLIRLPKGVKDPSEWYSNTSSKAQREQVADKFWKALWNSQKYSPAGVMSLSEGWSHYMTRGQELKLPFPDSFGELNERTHGGGALSEIINIIAPSSVGKSTFVKEYLYSIIHGTSYNIGVLSLEETIGEFIEGMLSTHMSTQLNEIPWENRNRKEEYEKFQELIHYHPTEDEEGVDESTVEKTERIHFLDHQGACSGDELLNKVDFLINGLDCKVIVLDPVTLACSGGDTDQDTMASEIVKRVNRHNVMWINVHHVRKNSSGVRANSEGGELSEEDVKGTGAWFQVGDINLIFTRNKVHTDPVIKNTTKIKMSKCRRHGKNTGIAGYTYYNGNTGRLELGQDLEMLLEEAADDEAINSF